MNVDLNEETLALRARYDEEPSHSDHVTALARQLFKGFHAWHRLDERDGELLTCAALLHDIGWSQTADGTGHHKESARLVSEHGWRSLKPAESMLVAQIARYHRKSLPQPQHVAFQNLQSADQKRVMILGGILRIADALDRTHTAKIECLKGSVTAQALIIRVKSSGSWKAEKAMFEIKRDLLQLAAGRPVFCETLE